MRKTILGSIGILVACGSALADNSLETVAQVMGVSKPTLPPAVGLPAAAALASAQTASINLTGSWTSNEGDSVKLEQKGDTITGSYHYVDGDGVTQEGRLEGTISDQTIQAKWWERPKVGKGEEMRGDLEWHVTQDGKMLAGWYRDEGDEEKTDWNLQR